MGSMQVYSLAAEGLDIMRSARQLWRGSHFAKHWQEMSVSLCIRLFISLSRAAARIETHFRNDRKSCFGAV
jgi:hypothetical protein